MDLTTLAEIAKQGVGVLFGLVVFVIYRLDRKASEHRYHDMLERDMVTREAHTAVLSELNTRLKMMNGHH